jgi:hypothetical protein
LPLAESNVVLGYLFTTCGIQQGACGFNVQAALANWVEFNLNLIIIWLFGGFCSVLEPTSTDLFWFV